MKEVIEEIERAKTITVLSGAGMSVESGIAPFRGDDGLWTKFDPKKMASVKGIEEHPKKCWELFKLQIEECLDATPHEGHKALVRLEEEGLKTIITQNVDGLHQKAGSKNVLELHGTLNELICDSCGNREKTKDLKYEIINGEIPQCQCGQVMRPNVILFGEALPRKVLRRAWAAVEKSSLLISIGTSAVVQPAASLPAAAKRNGATMIEINVERTPLTSKADFFLKDKVGEILPRLVKKLEA